MKIDRNLLDWYLINDALWLKGGSFPRYKNIFMLRKFVFALKFVKLYLYYDAYIDKYS